MARFDFVECASKSYQYVWTHRKDIARPTALVLLVKFLGFVVILALGFEGNLLRQGLLLMPVYFLEGWVIAHIMVRAFQTEEDPAYKAPNKGPINIKEAVLASSVMYVLIKLLLSFMAGMPTAIDPEAFSHDADTHSAETSPGLFLVAVVLMLFLTWAFRFLWLYVLPLLGLTVREFIAKTRPFTSSFYMIGLYVMCVVPIGLAFLLTSEALMMFFPALEGDEIPLVQKYILTFTHGFFDYIMILVSSLGIGYGISSIFNAKDKSVSLF